MVPITGATLQDVVDEIDGTQTSLQECVSTAVAFDYDVTYYTTPATSLREFRGYENATPTSVTVTALPNLVTKNGVSTPGLACARPSGDSDWVYYTPSGTLADGQTLYSNTPGTIKVNGGDNYFTDGTDDKSFRVSSVGVISLVDNCII